LLNAGNDVQRWWRLVYTVLTGMVELLRVGRVCAKCRQRGPSGLGAWGFWQCWHRTYCDVQMDGHL